MRYWFFGFLLFSAFISQALASSWGNACKPFTEECLFFVASKEMHGASQGRNELPLFAMAFHAGRLGYDSIPSGDYDFATSSIQREASKFLGLGRAVRQGRLRVNIEQPIKGLGSELAAPYVLPESLLNLSPHEIISILEASDLLVTTQAAVVGRLLAADLNRGEYRLVRGQIQGYIDFLKGLDERSLALTSLAITLAEEGYVSEADKIITSHLVPINHIQAQDVMMYLKAIQAVFDENILQSLSLASAIQSSVFRLEALGHLYSITRDSFVGNQYLSALYEFSDPLTPNQRRNIVLFAISMMR